MIRKPCIDCGTLGDATRCTTCQAKRQRIIDASRVGKREHYRGDYARRAKAVREAATACWLCGEGARPDDPWQADHVVPGDPNSPLAPAHRSCNIRRRFAAGG